MYRFFLFFVISCLAITAHAKSKVVTSPHNLSASGPGNFKSLSTNQVCVFCHVPHGVVPDAPMWNREDSGQSYIQYNSSTLMSEPGQPEGSSRLCLACHDGTIALERMAVNPAGISRNASSRRLSGRSNLGTDLSDDHPISFVYDSALAAASGQLVHPSGIPLPMESGMLRCGTCHEPHDTTYAPFLRLPSENGDLCTACHDQSGLAWSWSTSSHATSQDKPKGKKPWKERKPQWRGATVAENACFNCHTPHNATTPERLITDEEEAVCLRCHDGSVDSSDIQSELFKPSRHAVNVTPNPDHDAASIEDPLRMRLHVECGDCHNPHAAREAEPMVTVNPRQGRMITAQAPLANARIIGVSGIASGGSIKPEIDMQYEMCFKCHGVPGRSACGNSRCKTAMGMNHQRVDRVYNLRDKVDPASNPALTSYHPIVQNDPFNDNDVPSLRRELGLNTSSTLIYCTDCHNSDQSSAGTGNGAEGPHGSIYPPILADRYSLRPMSLGSTVSEAALCFKCHDAARLQNINTASGYLHNSHQQRGTCITCHDPHGSARFEHLINFETQNNLAPAGASPLITGAGLYSEPTWIETPDGGECWLRCHTGTDHLGATYPEDMEGGDAAESFRGNWPRD
jgi:predicted CXXCH cytochrome family protein